MNPVVTVHLPGCQPDRSMHGLLGAAQRLAAELGQEHIAMTLGVEASVAEAIGMRAGQVLELLGSQTETYETELTLAQLEIGIENLTPACILLDGSTGSQELAPRLAHRMQGCSAGDCQKLSVSAGKIQVTRAVYGGKATAVMQMNVSPAVVWLRAPAFEPATENGQPAERKSVEVKLSADALEIAQRTKIKERSQASSGEVRLEDSQVIVSGGRGLGGPEPFNDLRQLAETMKAQVGASRAACDSGWVDHGLQIGQTGKKVAPELYLAVAISGASQHIMGIADAKVVAAINTDEEAPIFAHCAFGIVEDYRNVIEPLRQKIQAMLT